jgi:hypothetical protein
VTNASLLASDLTARRASDTGLRARERRTIHLAPTTSAALTGEADRATRRILRGWRDHTVKHPETPELLYRIGDTTLRDYVRIF